VEYQQRSTVVHSDNGYKHPAFQLVVSNLLKGGTTARPVHSVYSVRTIQLS
jgi:hypothetical protein